MWKWKKYDNTPTYECHLLHAILEKRPFTLVPLPFKIVNAPFIGTLMFEFKGMVCLISNCAINIPSHCLWLRSFNKNFKHNFHYWWFNHNFHNLYFNRLFEAICHQYYHLMPSFGCVKVPKEVMFTMHNAL
jgi:hypothetical protein